MDEFARECIARAEGNPLFLEQLLRTRLAGGDGKLPHSLQGVVLARLDSLAAAERQALQAASVLGQRFVAEDLQALLGSADFDCRPMIQRHLLRAEGEGYLFAHALIRDGVYASLTRDRKRALHLKAAARFAGRDPALEAEHLDRAEDPSAARAYLRAAEAEAAVYRLDRANALVTRGLELADRDDDPVKLGLAAGRLRLDAGLAKSARAAFATAATAANAQTDRCRAHIGLAAADRVLADLDRALENLSAAEAIAAAMDSPALLSEIHYMRGNLYFARGQGEECLREQPSPDKTAAIAGHIFPQGPACASLGRFGTGQGDQFGLLLAIENSGHRRRRSLLAVQHRRKALLHQLLAHPVDRGRVGIQSPDDLVVTPSSAGVRDIGLQQDACFQQRSRRAFALADQRFELPTFLPAQPHNILLY
jgi:tetratricopeptide (TPR) repeat protein